MSCDKSRPRCQHFLISIRIVIVVNRFIFALILFGISSPSMASCDFAKIAFAMLGKTRSETLPVSMSPQRLLARFEALKSNGLREVPEIPLSQLTVGLRRDPDGHGTRNRGLFLSELNGEVVHIKSLADREEIYKHQALNEAGISTGFKGFVKMADGSLGLVTKHVKGLVLHCNLGKCGRDMSRHYPVTIAETTQSQLLALGRALDVLGTRSPDLQVMIGQAGDVTLMDLGNLRINGYRSFLSRVDYIRKMREADPRRSLLQINSEYDANRRKTETQMREMYRALEEFVSNPELMNRYQ